jgi:hypothetical protein
MFLGMLDGYQQNAFMALALRLVMADGTIHPTEETLLRIRTAEMGGDVSAPPLELVDMPNLGLFNTRASRVIVMLELYVLAFSDEYLSPNELPILDELAEVFGFNEADLAPLRRWAQGQAPYSIEGWNLIHGEQQIPVPAR